MHGMCGFVRVAAFLIVIGVTFAVEAQPPAHPDQHQHPSVPQQGEHQHHPPPQEQDHVHDGPMPFDSRQGSGTAWLPQETPMYGIHSQAGPWQVMWHGNAFAQYLYESGDRGNDQAGSINWIMGMVRRDVRGGRLGLRGMVSLEPWTISGCGYPDLLATGEVCNGESIHDRQHPHDLFMEVAAEYDRALRGPLRWQIYGGLAGEPALGPVAYPHRVSAMPNPLAPISHHWLDATHITFGVVTAGIYSGAWKAEASAFNGREPDENRAGFDFAPLDSFSGRVWFLPASSVSLQISAGHLNEAEEAHEGGPRVSVNRVTASATYHRALGAGSVWASTIAWGRNVEEDEATNAVLLETNVTLHERDTWFGRLEVAGKPAHDLDVHGRGDVFTVGKLQVGYTRYLSPLRGLKPGFGAGFSAGFVPLSLKPVYGGRTNLGFGLYLTLRPAAHRM